jgi:hypothetical protein
MQPIALIYFSNDSSERPSDDELSIINRDSRQTRLAIAWFILLAGHAYVG